MKYSMGIWQLMGFSITALAGTLLHFLYEWLGEAVWVASFSGVNESTWEHMKLLFWPTFFFAIIESRFFKERKEFWCIKLRGIALGLLLIPVLFYTYNGIFGKSPDFINIGIFFLSLAIAYIYETRLFNKTTLHCKHPTLAFSLLSLIALLFVIFTFAPPTINLFKDPITNTYGISA